MTPSRLAIRIAVTVWSLCALGACNRNLVPQETSRAMPDSFRAKGDSTAIAAINWREFFSDTLLVRLIDTVLSENLDSRIALQRIQIAEARLQFSKGEQLPKVGATVVPSIRRFGLYTMDGAGNSTTDILPGQIVPTNLPDYLVGFQTTWEADIWGKLKNRKKAAAARYLATLEGRNWLVTNIVAETVAAYYHLVGLDWELEIVRENITLQENALDIVIVQKETGRANELAVEQFRAQLLNTRALEAEIQQQIVETESLINLMAGRYPQDTPRDKSALERQVPQSFSVGLPSDLLRNRPDIRQAELEVAASKADVAAARAAFYPSLNISGGVGFQSFKPSLLFDSPESFVFTAIGGITMPLVNRNAIKSELKASKAYQVETLYNYQKAVMTGYVEVYNELSNQEKLSRISALADEEVRVLNQSIETSRELFGTGRATYLEVLLAQQKSLEARLDFVEVRKRQLISAVNLYKALGGGW